MAIVRAYGIFAQLDVAASADQTLYTCPASTRFVGSDLLLCNRGAVALLVRVRLRKNNEAHANKQFIVYDYPVEANDTLPMKLGMTLNDGDVIEITSDTATLSATLFGFQETGS